MKKLFVAGGSFSDYTRVDKVYGEFLAEKLGYEYIHEGAGCGSNWRIWRTITNHIMTGNLTSDDLLIVQYTGREREEFWTDFPQPDRAFLPNTTEHLTIIDKCNNGGVLIRFKANAGSWQWNDEEVNFFNKYEKYFVNVHFENERFRAHNFMFQHMLLSNNIKTIFVCGSRVPPLLEKELLPEFRKSSYNMLSIDPAHNLAPDDVSHMNQLGHEVFAGWLYDHINKINIKG